MRHTRRSLYGSRRNMNLGFVLVLLGIVAALFGYTILAIILIVIGGVLLLT